MRSRFLHRGFTLVELLVVMGILAVLLSILLPVLNTARAASRNVKCQSNLRVIMAAALQYSIDNQGDLVPANWYNDAVPSPNNFVKNPDGTVDMAYGANYPSFWWEAVPSDSVFLGHYTDAPGISPFDGRYNIWGQIVSPNSVWVCPEKTWAPFVVLTDPYDNPVTSYSMNQDGGTCPVIRPDYDNAGNKLSTGWEKEYKMAAIRSPSLMMSFVCSTSERFGPSGNYFGNLGGVWWNWGGGTPGANYNLALRHPGNSTNVAFMDGHVENIQATMYSAWGYTGLSLYPALAGRRFVVSPQDQ
jgi:prepilin-type N-terminal cleavage/methylation domain-containing protein/prepilin-type processing-associated H-X9-DG protein